MGNMRYIYHHTHKISHNETQETDGSDYLYKTKECWGLGQGNLLIFAILYNSLLLLLLLFLSLLILRQVLTMLPSLALNPKSSCLILRGSRIAKMHPMLLSISIKSF